MTYKVYTVSTASWGDRVEIPVLSCAWGRCLNEGFSGQATFALADPGVVAAVSNGHLNVLQRCLVVEFDGQVVYAGIIWDSTYDRDSRRLSVSHADLWSLWAVRLISQDRTSTIATWKQPYLGFSYRTLLKRMVQLGTTGTGRIVPIVYEPDFTGSANRTYYGYNLDTVIEALDELMHLENGPDIDFRPEWDGSGGLRWQMVTGDLAGNGGMIEVNFAADQPQATGLVEKVSSREKVTQVFGVGEGSGVDMKVSVGTGTPVEFAIERVEQAKNIKSGAQLNEFTQGELMARIPLIYQYEMNVEVRSPVIGANPSSLRPGMVVRWFIMDDPKITAGWRTCTIIKYSGEVTSDFIHLESQEDASWSGV